MKQPHTEQAVDHTDDQQNTGNHKKPGTPGSGGADRTGGTRTGARNVEPAPGATKSGPDGGHDRGVDPKGETLDESGATRG